MKKVLLIIALLFAALPVKESFAAEELTAIYLDFGSTYSVASYVITGSVVVEKAFYYKGNGTLTADSFSAMPPGIAVDGIRFNRGTTAEPIRYIKLMVTSGGVTSFKGYSDINLSGSVYTGKSVLSYDPIIGPTATPKPTATPTPTPAGLLKGKQMIVSADIRGAMNSTTTNVTDGNALTLFTMGYSGSAFDTIYYDFHTAYNITSYQLASSKDNLRVLFLHSDNTRTTITPTSTNVTTTVSVNDVVAVGVVVFSGTDNPTVNEFDVWGVCHHHHQPQLRLPQTQIQPYS